MPRARNLAGLLLGGVLAANTPSVLAQDPSPSPLQALDPVAVVIASLDEPGMPLRIDGTAIDQATGEPVAGVEIVVYQADDGGGYEPTDPSDESTARLRGDLVTDPEGHFAFRTVLPGEYPDQPPGNRHVHVHSVTAEGYEPRGFIILFDDNVRDEVRTWATSTGFGEIIELTSKDGLLTGSLEITLEPLPGEASSGA